MGERRVRNMVEFAEVSGLSRPTIAKYFSDPASVRPATRQKIEAALQKHEFRPNLFAVNLNKKKSNLIGIVVPDATDPFYANLVRHIELDCTANGYLAVVLSSHGDPRMEARALDSLLLMRVAGAIVAPLGVSTDAALLEGLRARMPVVFLDSRLDDASPFVGTDNAQSIDLVTDYLCRTGEAPTYVDLPPVNRNGEERRTAYVRAMERLGLTPEVITLGRQPSWRFEDVGSTEGLRLLERGALPTRTLLCVNDRLALGLMAAAWQARLKVGRDPGTDLRIAGHDDQPISRLLSPPLTTVAQDVRQLGARCLDILLAHLDNAADPEADRVVLEARLMMRASA